MSTPRLETVRAMSKVKVVVGFLCLWLVGCDTQPPPTPRLLQTSPSPRPHDALDDSLRKTAARLIEAIHEGNTQGFLELCSREGVEMGADNEVSYEKIRRAFDRREPLYCHYFDTSCLQEYLKKVNYKSPEDLHGILPLPVSYREILSRASGLEISSVEVKRWDYAPVAGQVSGFVTVRWKSPRPRDFGFEHFFNFVFALEKGEWKLIGDSTY